MTCQCGRLLPWALPANCSSGAKHRPFQHLPFQVRRLTFLLCCFLSPPLWMTQIVLSLQIHPEQPEAEAVSGCESLPLSATKIKGVGKTKVGRRGRTKRSVCVWGGGVKGGKERGFAEPSLICTKAARSSVHLRRSKCLGSKAAWCPFAAGEQKAEHGYSPGLACVGFVPWTPGITSQLAIHVVLSKVCALSSLELPANYSLLFCRTLESSPGDRNPMESFLPS